MTTKPFTAAQIGSALGRLLPHGWELPADEPTAEPQAQVFL